MQLHNSKKQEILRAHLKEALTGEKAHITFDRVVAGFPLQAINRTVAGISHSPWCVVEHMRRAQRDIIEFIKNPNYSELEWPEDYWPKEEADAFTWNQAVEDFIADRKELLQLLEDDSVELLRPISHAPKYTLFREILLMANHHSYHTGQLVYLKQALEA